MNRDSLWQNKVGLNEHTISFELEQFALKNGHKSKWTQKKIIVKKLWKYYVSK